MFIGVFAFFVSCLAALYCLVCLRSVLSVDRGLLCAGMCMLVVVCCMMIVVCCLLLVVFWLLCCCLVFVVCWVLVVVNRCDLFLLFAVAC